MNTKQKIVKHKITENFVTFKELTEQANNYLSVNKIKEAYPYVKAVAHSSESTIDDKMSAGLIAISLQLLNDASELFTLILKDDSSHFDAHYNLALIELTNKNYSQAYSQINSLANIYPDKAELNNDLAIIATHLHETKKAFKHWKDALKQEPHNSTYRNNALAYSLENNFFKEANQLLSSNEKSVQNDSKTKAEINRWQEIINTKDEEIITSSNQIASSQISGKKIAFFSSIDSFVGDIISHLKFNNDVKVFDNSDLNEMKRLMEWADISWFEWCDQYLIEATKFDKKSKIVCRLHSYEAFTDFPLQVDWEKVDLLIFVNKSVQELVADKITTNVSQIIIHNAVDFQKFYIPKKKKQGKKIASVGYINYKKNPELMLYCFKKIYEYDNEYSLHIAGQHQDSRIKLYFDHFMKENNLPIIFDGWVDNMPEWYADKDFVISTSLFESFHYSIAEGMASGVMPLIHNWYGAKYLYPEKYIYNTPDDCLEMLIKLEKSNLKNIAIENRDFILKNYNKDDKMREISTKLFNLLVEKELTEVG